MNEIYSSLLKSKKDKLSLFDNKMRDVLKSHPTDLEDYFEKFLFNSPKRLRPLFIFLLCDYLGVEINDRVLSFALAVEFLHSASLIHDDILDDGTLRRNMECVHLKFGMKTAVLAGDYLLSLAMGEIAKINSTKLLEMAACVAYKMASSELNALQKRFEPSNIEDYIKLSKEKTSSLFEFCVFGVGIIFDIEIQENIFEFARNFALCFQIKDDINNFLNQDKGKSSNDKKCGISTLPSILNSCGIINETEFLEKLLKKTADSMPIEFKNTELFKLVNLLK